MKLEYKFSDKYIGLNTPLTFELPKQLVVERETLVLKDEFHMSIHCIIKTKEAHPEISHEEIINHFNNFVKTNQIEYTGFKPELRFCEQENKRTVVVMVETKNLEEYFNDFNNMFNVNIPTQPAHITLYTKQSNIGIDLTSQEELTNLSKTINNKELENILFNHEA